MPLKIEECFLFHQFKDILVRHVLQLPNVNKIKFRMEEVFKALKVIWDYNFEFSSYFIHYYCQLANNLEFSS